MIKNNLNENREMKEEFFKNLSFDELVSEIVLTKEKISKSDGQEKVNLEQRLELLDDSMLKFSKRLKKVEEYISSNEEKNIDNTELYSVRKEINLEQFKKQFFKSSKANKKKLLKELKENYIRDCFENNETFNSLIYHNQYQKSLESKKVGINIVQIFIISLLAPCVAFFLPNEGVAGFPYGIWLIISWIFMMAVSYSRKMPNEIQGNLDKLYEILGKPSAFDFFEKMHKHKIPTAIVLDSLGLDIDSISEEDFKLKTINSIVDDEKFIEKFSCLSK